MSQSNQIGVPDQETQVPGAKNVSVLFWRILLKVTFPFWLVNNKRKSNSLNFVFELHHQSPVQRIAFSANWDNSSLIFLPDIEPQAFRQFLKLIFTDKIDKGIIKSLDLPLDEIFNILYISTKYDVDGITRAIFDFLEEQITIKNAIYIYENISGIDNNCNVLQFITDNFEKIMCQDEFLQVPMEVLAEFLKSNELRVNEIDLFKALCRWGRFQFNKRNGTEGVEISGENLRNILGDLLPLIRFPLFPSQDFVDQIPKGLLKLEESHSTLSYIVLSDERKKRMLEENDVPFNVQKRRKPNTELKTVSYLLNPGERFICNPKGSFTLDISTTRKIRVHSFVFHGTISNSCKYNVNINVKKVIAFGEEILFNFDENIVASKGKCFNINVPVVLKPNNIGTHTRFTFTIEGDVNLPASCVFYVKPDIYENIRFYNNAGLPSPLAKILYEHFD